MLSPETSGAYQRDFTSKEPSKSGEFEPLEKGTLEIGFARQKRWVKCCQSKFCQLKKRLKLHGYYILKAICMYFIKIQ